MTWQMLLEVILVPDLGLGPSLPLACLNALANLLRDLHRNDVVAVDILVVYPAVRRADKVLKEDQSQSCEWNGQTPGFIK